jgi:transposase
MRQDIVKREALTIGVDLGDDFSQYCRLDVKGAVEEEGRVKMTEDALRKTFSRFPPSLLAMETGTHSPWVSRLMKECGHEVLVANSRKLRLIYQSTKKTDRVDAHSLAKVARLDPALLYPIEHRGRQAQADLSVIRARDTMVGARTMLINSVRGLLKSSGRRVRSCATDAFAQEAPESVPDDLKPAINPMLETIQTLSEKIAALDQTIEAVAKERYPEAARLRQVRGVGPLTSLTYILTLERWSRFKDGRAVGAYLGLTSRKSQSGGQDPEMHITKAGDATLRRLLVGSAQCILRGGSPDSDLRRWGLKLAERGGKNQKKRAVVAVARKLAALLHLLWKSEVDYEPLRNAKRLERQQQTATDPVKERAAVSDKPDPRRVSLSG